MARIRQDDAPTRRLGGAANGAGDDRGGGAPQRRGWMAAAVAALGMLLVVAAGAIVALAVLGGDDQDADEAVAAASIRLDAPLERLSATARDARAGRPASLVALRSAAARAVEQLDDEEARIESLAVEVRDQPSVAAFEDALDATRQLAEALALTRPRAVLVAGLASEQEAAVDALAGPSLPAIDSGAVVVALRRRQAAPDAAAGEPAVATDEPTTTTAPSSSTSGLPDFAVRSAFGYQARLPTGGGWAAPADSQPNARLFRTSVRGPDGLFVIVDYTPNDEAVFGGRYDSRAEVGQTAFGSATEYVFQGGSLPECQRSPCVDYITNDPVSAEGFAVLAGGGDLSLVREIARTVMESLTPDAG